MRKVIKATKKNNEPYGDVPPGGRAFQRLQQDRIARGIVEAPPTGKLILEDSTPAGTEAPARKRKSKQAKRS